MPSTPWIRSATPGCTASWTPRTRPMPSCKTCWPGREMRFAWATRGYGKVRLDLRPVETAPADDGENWSWALHTYLRQLRSAGFTDLPELDPARYFFFSVGLP